MNAIRKALPGSLDDGAAVGSGIDALNVKFAALREAIDKAIDGPADARKDAAKKIVADNAVFNTAVTTLLDEQVRRMALLDGDAYRQASYANIAWTLRDVGGYNASLHKNLVGAKRVGDRGREDGSEPRPGPHRPDPDVAAGIARQSRDAGQCGGGAGQDERRLCRSLRQGAEDGQGRRHQRQIRARCRHLLCGIATRPRRRHRGARRLLRQRRADPRLRLFLGALQLPDRARRPDRRDRAPAPA